MSKPIFFRCRCCGVFIYGELMPNVEPLCRDCVKWALSKLTIR